MIRSFKSHAPRLAQILFDDSLHIPGWNAVKVEHVRNGYADRLGKGITSRIERHGTGP
jgi:hypothetical protein